MRKYQSFTPIEIHAKVSLTDDNEVVLYLKISAESGLAELFASVPTMKIVVSSQGQPSGINTNNPLEPVYEFVSNKPSNQRAEPEQLDTDPQQLLLSEITGKSLRQIEQLVIEEMITHNGGSVPKAAKSLKVSPSTIYRKRDTWHSE